MLSEIQNIVLNKLILKNQKHNDIYLSTFNMECKDIFEIIIKATNPKFLQAYVQNDVSVVNLLNFHLNDEIDYLTRLIDFPHGIKIALEILKILDEKTISYFDVAKIYRGCDTIFGFLYDQFDNLIENSELIFMEESKHHEIITHVINHIETKLKQIK